jgi:hypothetical protein
MDHIWKTIKQDVQNKHWDTNGLQELFDKNLDVILTKHSITCNTIPRNGDIVVGFYLDHTSQASKLLQLEIGGEPLSTLNIKPGEFVYTFENTHVYPIIAVSFSELRIGTDDNNDFNGLYVIYALIRDQHLRRDIAMNKQVLRLTSGKLASFRGCFGYLSLDKYPDSCNEIPNMLKI